MTWVRSIGRAHDSGLPDPDAIARILTVPFGCAWPSKPGSARTSLGWSVSAADGAEPGGRNADHPLERAAEVTRAHETYALRELGHGDVLRAEERDGTGERP